MGLYAGSQEYCKRLNFKGMVSGLPFDIKETSGMKINDKPLVYPEHCGAPAEPGSGLPGDKEYDISRYPSGVNPRNEIITFAYDSAYFYKHTVSGETLPHPFMHRVIRERYRSGYRTIMVTSRKGMDTDLRRELNSLVIPAQHIFFTNGKLKGPLLKKIGSVLHYDGDDKQIESAREHGIKAIKI